jgi:hypothetical protein
MSEPGGYEYVSTPEPFTLDTLHTEIEKLKEQNVPHPFGPNMEELLILRDYLRDPENPHIDPANEYVYVGDGHVDVKVERTLQWWNDYWSKKTGVPVDWAQCVVLTGRYRVYSMDEQWLYCRWESEL